VISRPDSSGIGSLLARGFCLAFHRIVPQCESHSGVARAAVPGGRTDKCGRRRPFASGQRALHLFGTRTNDLPTMISG
jgi:hypothetical protein